MKNRIKELREASGLTQSELGERIGCSGVNIGRYEKETRRVNMTLLASLAKALGVRPADIISDTDVAYVAAAQVLKVRGTNRVVAFDRGMLKDLAAGAPVEALQIDDDAMEPTLPKGALALVDVFCTSVGRDGIYLIKIGAMEAVRRINIQLNGSLRVSADNARKAAEMMARPEELSVLGRVLWAGGPV